MHDGWCSITLGSTGLFMPHWLYFLSVSYLHGRDAHFLIIDLFVQFHFVECLCIFFCLIFILLMKLLRLKRSLNLFVGNCNVRISCSWYFLQSQDDVCYFLFTSSVENFTYSQHKFSQLFLLSMQVFCFIQS